MTEMHKSAHTCSKLQRSNADKALEDKKINNIVIETEISLMEGERVEANQDVI